MYEISARTVPIAAFNDVRRVEGLERIRHEYPGYLSDESRLTPGPFEYLFFPMDEAELAVIFKEMAHRKIKITIAGARTGLVGGCVPGEGALVSLENMNHVLAVCNDPHSAEWRVKAQSAVNLHILGTQVKTKNFTDIERCGDSWALEQLNIFKAAPANYFYPPDPTEMSASLGGTVATNASGARTFRYGSTRDWVRAIRVMLPNGEILCIPRGKFFSSANGEFVIYDSSGNDIRLNIPTYQMPRTKNTSGIYAAPHMDLIDLFIGSEGSFGAITEVTVALLEFRNKMSIVQFLDSDDQAIHLAEALRKDKGTQLDFLEFYSGNALDLLRRRQMQDPRVVDMPQIPKQAGAALFFEFSFDPLSDNSDDESLSKALSKYGVSASNSWAAYENRELERMKNFRHILPETINAIIAERKHQHPQLHKLGTDLAVPDEHLRDMWEVYQNALENAGLQWAAFGHIGNNHIHVNILPRDMQELEKGLELYRRFAQKAVAFGGAVSAEHGIGKMKVEFLEVMYSPQEIDEMRALKQAIDPENFLNPGNLFADTQS